MLEIIGFRKGDWLPICNPCACLGGFLVLKLYPPPWYYFSTIYLPKLKRLSFKRSGLPDQSIYFVTNILFLAYLRMWWWWQFTLKRFICNQLPNNFLKEAILKIIKVRECYKNNGRNDLAVYYMKITINKLFSFRE